MKKKLKVVFIGAGKMSREHIKVFDKIKSVELKGIYSRTKKKAESLISEYKGLVYYNSIKELYEKTRADLVIISVSVENTKKVCLEACKFSWKCLVEKPFGYNFKETQYLAKKLINKKQFYVALNRNYYSTTQKILEILKNDKTKRVIYINDQENIKENYKKYPKKVLNNFMYANSIHLVDFIRIFARGNLLDVKTIFNLKTKSSHSFAKSLKFSSGDIVVFTSFWERPAPWSLSISTENYFFDMKPLESLQVKSKKNKKKIIFSQKLDDINFKSGLMMQAQKIVEKINNKKNFFPGVKEILHTTNLINRIF